MTDEISHISYNANLKKHTILSVIGENANVFAKINIPVRKRPSCFFSQSRTRWFAPWKLYTVNIQFMPDREMEEIPLIYLKNDIRGS